MREVVYKGEESSYTGLRKIREERKRTESDRKEE